MQPGIWQILIVAIVVLVLFGRGRISEMMGDFGKGISSFKLTFADGLNACPEYFRFKGAVTNGQGDNASGKWIHGYAQHNRKSIVDP